MQGPQIGGTSRWVNEQAAEGAGPCVSRLGFSRPHCWSDQLEWMESHGRGSILSFSVVHRAPTPAFAATTPYVIALIDLDEGPRMFANIVGDNSHDVAIGDRVSVIYEARGDGAMLPQFTRFEG